MDAYETGRFAEVDDAALGQVRTADDLAELLARMRTDLLATGHQEWENATLDRFLAALAAVVMDFRIEGQPTWGDLAQLLFTASGYE